VVGDYNNKIGDAAMQTVEGAGFRSIWNDLEIDVSEEFTYNAQNPQKNHGVIDHILYRVAAGSKATDGGIIELKNPLSDHKPIWAKIVFRRDLEAVRQSQ
jgi:exonuclease III